MVLFKKVISNLVFAMSTFLRTADSGSGSRESLVEEGVREFAREIEDLIGYSANPQRYRDIRQHFEEDDRYFEEDLGHLSEALRYLEEEGSIKKDVRIFDVDEPAPAYALERDSI